MFKQITSPCCTLKNGCSVNSPDFWDAWVDVGGNMDGYVKEALSTYGVVGALALTQQMGLANDPPDGDPQSAMLVAYASVSHLASLLSFALVIVPMVVTTQYNCCTDQTSKRRFICKYGYLIPLLFIILILMSMAWLATILLAMHASYGSTPFTVILVETGVVASTLLISLPIRIQCWNANSNYGPAVDVLMKAKKANKEANADKEAA